MGVLPDWMIKVGVKIEPMAECENRPGVLSYGLTSYGYDARVGYKFRVFSPINAQVIDPKAFDPKALVEVDLTPPPHLFKLWRDTQDNPYWRCEACDVCTDNNPELYQGTCAYQKPDHILIPPHSFVLAETVEYFEILRDCLAIVLGKSTYARSGLVVSCTPLEPEWRGKITVELCNTTPLPMKVYCGEGIMQIIFLRSDGVRDTMFQALMNLLHLPNFLSPTHQKHLIGNLRSDSRTCQKSYADKKGKYQNQDGLTLPKVTKKDGES
jgi:dCTP deaminase